MQEAYQTSAVYFCRCPVVGSYRISDSFMGKAGGVIFSDETRQKGQKAFLGKPHPSMRLQHVTRDEPIMLFLSPIMPKKLPIMLKKLQFMLLISKFEKTP